ncbi:hypothetical protein AAD001_16285 [Colwelliaceae bacterium 6471]
MKTTGFLILVIALQSFYCLAMPRITVENDRTIEGYAKIRIKNETARELACHIAIDGFKIKFRLLPRQPSKWHKAADKRFKHTDFSVWCDYIELYPEHKKYGQ